MEHHDTEAEEKRNLEERESNEAIDDERESNEATYDEVEFEVMEDNK